MSFKLLRKLFCLAIQGVAWQSHSTHSRLFTAGVETPLQQGSLSQTSFPYQLDPRFPIAGSHLNTLSYLFSMQNTKPAWAGCLQGGTLNNWIPELLYSCSLSVPYSGVLLLSLWLLQCLLSVYSPGWPQRSLCCAKGLHQFMAFCLGLPSFPDTQSPTCSSYLQLHTDIYALNAFFNWITEVWVCWLFTSSRVLYYPTCWVSWSLPLCIMNFVEWELWSFTWCFVRVAVVVHWGFFVPDKSNNRFSCTGTAAHQYTPNSAMRGILNHID